MAAPIGYGLLSDMNIRRALIKLSFTDKLIYDRNDGFRTAAKSGPLRLLEEFSLGKTEMVGHSGKSSNHFLDILTEWNDYLEDNCSGIYNQILQPTPTLK